ELRAERRTPHPRLELKVFQPVLDRRNPAEIVLDVLLADGADRNRLADAVRQRRPEDRLAQEDAFAVVAERAMAHVGDVRLALVEPVVDREVVARLTAEQARRTHSVMIGMSHRGPTDRQ